MKSFPVETKDGSSFPSCSVSDAGPGDKKGLCYVGEEISVTPGGERDPNYTYNCLNPA